jgi:hypothetical protein
VEADPLDGARGLLERRLSCVSRQLMNEHCLVRS